MWGGTVLAADCSVPEWQSHIQALIQRQAEVLIHSSLPDAEVRAMHLEPCPDVAAAVTTRLERMGPQAKVAVLPQGPLTIPYLKNGLAK